MRVFWGRMVAPVPLDSCPAREPLRMALAGATRRCFALLGAFPARRDDGLQGALGIGGVGRGRVRVGRSGGVGLLVCHDSDLLWRRVACR